MFEKHILIFGYWRVGTAIDFQQTVDCQERNEQQTITLIDKTPYKSGPNNPIRITEQYRKATTQGLEFTKEKEHEKIQQHTVDEYIGVGP